MYEWIIKIIKKINSIAVTGPFSLDSAIFLL